MILRRITAVALAAATVALAGCGIELSRLNPWAEAAEQSRIPRGATVYTCASGKKLMLRFLDGGKAVMVIYPEREFRLDQQVAASGARYSNGRTTLSTKGDESFLEEGSETLFAGCKKTES